ncbi:MAG: hypothetical protein KIS96_02720 [Bauldia sp.]|nr:hypothetical protein [Bauldia sp.]
MSFDESKQAGALGGDEALRPRQALRRIAAVAEQAAALPPGDPGLTPRLRELTELARRGLAFTPADKAGRGGRKA